MPNRYEKESSPQFPPARIFSKGYHPHLLRVPQIGTHGLETLPKGQRIDMFIKQRSIAVALGEIVVRYGRAEMMYVVIADIAGQPVKYFRQAVVGTTLHSREHVVPVLFAVLVDILVLMLYVEKPQRISTEEEQVDKLYEQKEIQKPHC
jgi:hypothetical protein